MLSINFLAGWLLGLVAGNPARVIGWRPGTEP